MQRQVVSSSNIRSIGYDPISHTLEIEFHDGVYRYSGVPDSVYAGLMAAPSHGKYFHAHIKGNYSFTRVA